MRLYSSDYKKTVDVGNGSLWHALHSTAVFKISNDDYDIMQFAMIFLASSTCNRDDAQITARQMELLKKRLARIPPTEVVYDMNDLRKKTPWGNFLSKSVTSCADLFTTADGKNLLDEIIALLKYADKNHTDVIVM